MNGNTEMQVSAQRQGSRCQRYLSLDLWLCWNDTSLKICNNGYRSNETYFTKKKRIQGKGFTGKSLKVIFQFISAILRV